MAIFKCMLLKLLEQHYQIYVLLFYYGLIIIITGISDLRRGSWSVVALIHFDCSAEERRGSAWTDGYSPCTSDDWLRGGVDQSVSHSFFGPRYFVAVRFHLRQNPTSFAGFERIEKHMFLKNGVSAFITVSFTVLQAINLPKTWDIGSLHNHY